MKVTLSAHFNGVTKNRISSTLECEQLRASMRTGAARGKSSAKDVGHLHQFVLVTDRAVLFGRASDVLGRAKELGVSITDIVFLNLARGQTGEQGPANEPEFNDGANRGGGSALAFHEIEATRFPDIPNFSGFHPCNLC